jgi:hypothetical protein
MATPTANAKEIIDCINILRSNPPKFASKIEEYIKYFKGQILKIPDINVQIRTQEGDAPYKETVEFLKKEEPVNQLIASKALCQIAQEILEKVVDSETGEIEESETEELIDKHGSFSGKFTRAMDFGGFTSEQVVINFLVCDGDPERTQREPLLGRGLKKVGVAFGKHNIYSTVCVLVSCTEFTNTVDADDTPVFPEVVRNQDKEKQIEIEKEQQKELERKKAEEEKKRKEEEKKIEEEKKRKEEEKKIEEEKKRKEEEKKKEEERKRKEDEKKKVEAKKKVATTTTKTSQNQGTGGDPFKFPKRKFFAVTAVGKEELPEGVASMTKRDTIVIEGGKRYKKIIINKVMLDGTKKTEEIKQCLD